MKFLKYDGFFMVDSPKNLMINRNLCMRTILVCYQKQISEPAFG